MRTLVVTAADEVFAPLLRRLISSLLQWGPQPFTNLAFFDLGVAPEMREWIARHAAHIVEPAWDLPVAMKLRMQQPQLRALTVRPFLPDYFPGYDLYLWIDADAWVQERFALDWYFAGASQGALAAATHFHGAYRQTRETFEWRMNRERAYFGGGRPHIHWDAYFNAGVFALRGDAPHWRLWEKWFREGIHRSNGRVCCDQTALNQALWVEGLPVNVLPATCNWLCHLALPSFDQARARLCEPIAPTRVIGVVHLSGDSKSQLIVQPALFSELRNRA